MIKTAITVFAATAVILMASNVGFAETRAQYFTPEQLQEQSTVVIKGTVRDIATPAGFKTSFPVRASVAAVVKGRWTGKETTFQHKHPGLQVDFEQEFNKPEIGRKGTFYRGFFGYTTRPRRSLLSEPKRKKRPNQSLQPTGHNSNNCWKPSSQ